MSESYLINYDVSMERKQKAEVCLIIHRGGRVAEDT